MKTHRWAIAWFVAAACSVCLAQSEPQSLADVARKARAEKKAVKVLTDDNYARRSAPNSSVASVRTATESNATSAQQPAPAGQSRKTENAQASGATAKADELKKQLDAYKAKQEAWNSSAKRYEDLLSNETDEFRRQMYQDALNNDRQNAKLYQSKIDQTQTELSQAQEKGQGQSAAKPAQSASGGGRP